LKCNSFQPFCILNNFQYFILIKLTFFHLCYYFLHSNSFIYDIYIFILYLSSYYKKVYFNDKLYLYLLTKHLMEISFFKKYLINFEIIGVIIWLALFRNFLSYCYQHIYNFRFFSFMLFRVNYLNYFSL
jgi:hypothetical protein